MGRHRRRWRGLAIGAMAVVLMAGCGDETQVGSDSGAEPTTYATIKDAAAFDTTRTEVGDVFRDASQLANDALGGEGLRGDGKVSDTLCNEAYPRRFSRLESGVTFVAPGRSLADALQRVSDAWKQRGWDVEVLEPDRARLSTKTSTGVPFGVYVSLQENQNDAGTVGAGVTLSTRCLKLPAGVVDSL